MFFNFFGYLERSIFLFQVLPFHQHFLLFSLPAFYVILALFIRPAGKFTFLFLSTSPVSLMISTLSVYPIFISVFHIYAYLCFSSYIYNLKTDLKLPVLLPMFSQSPFKGMKSVLYYMPYIIYSIHRVDHF